MPIAAADLAYKGIDKNFSPRCMVHFGVKLDAVKIAVHVLNNSNRRIVRMRYNFKSCWDFCNMIAVAHPDRTSAFNEKAVKKRSGAALA